MHVSSAEPFRACFHSPELHSHSCKLIRPDYMYAPLDMPCYPRLMFIPFTYNKIILFQMEKLDTKQTDI